MTTAAQVKKMVRPLLERHADLELVGRWIYVKPVQHFARAILIDRTSMANRFSARWAVIHLFQVRRSFTLSWGDHLDELLPGLSAFWWPTDAPGIAEGLCDAIEKQAMPWLRTMSTLQLYLAFVSQNLFRHHMYDKGDAEVIVRVAQGYVGYARKLCEQQVERWSTDEPYHDDDDRAHFRRLRELYPLVMNDDRAGLARLLHSWEAETVKNFKIEHLWEPTPFPLELQPPK
ncbi:MAG: hypothetical protein WDO17_11330 [Alphaproteobacteria bacterium]